MMDTVYMLWHITGHKGRHDDEKFIGVYSTRENARDAIRRLRRQPGFKDTPKDFQIFDHKLDRTGWGSGY